MQSKLKGGLGGVPGFGGRGVVVDVVVLDVVVDGGGVVVGLSLIHI